MVSPNHPVLVGSHQLNNTSADAEPVAMLAEASERVLATVPEIRDAIDLIAVVKGINPYNDPGSLLDDQLGLAALRPRPPIWAQTRRSICSTM